MRSTKTKYVGMVDGMKVVYHGFDQLKELELLGYELKRTTDGYAVLKDGRKIGYVKRR